MSADDFAVIGEGAALLARLDENAATFFDDLARLREILALLGDAAPADDAADLAGTVVADEDGKPLTVYHGTNAVFDQFDPMAAAKNRAAPGLDAIGSWFTTDIEQAKRYGSTIKAVHLNVKKPWRFTSFNELKDEWIDWNTMKGQSKDVKARHKINPHHGDAAGFVEMARRMGYDGIVIEAHSSITSTEFADGTTYIVFDAAQIKPLKADPAPAVPTSVTFDRYDSATSAASLSDYLAHYLPSMLPAAAAFEALTVHTLALMLGDAQGDAVANAATAAKNAIGDSTDDVNAARVAVFGHFKSNGISNTLDIDAMRAKQALGQEILKRTIKDNPDYVAASAEFKRVSDARDAGWRDYIARLNALETEATDTTADLEHRRALIEQHNALLAEFNAWKEKTGAEELAAAQRANDMSSAFYEKRNAEYFATHVADGEAIRAKVLETSPVTEEDSHAWAAKQIIQPGALEKLAKFKPPYAVEQLRLDMAEFYRMSGGRASSVQFSLDGGGRANADGVDAITTLKTINLGTYFNKRVLWHELAHYIENDPVARAASNGFLLARRESDTIYKLKDLAPDVGYDDNEVAYKDSFVNPYVGKVYPGGITEVFSMGVERLCSPKDAALFAAEDPEMFDLITGYMRTGVTPAMRAKLDFHTTSLDEAAAALVQKDKDYAAAYKALVASVTLAADDWYAHLPSDSAQYSLIYQYVQAKAKKKAWAYVGSNGDYRVFSGLFLERSSKRWRKGFLLLKVLPNDEYQVPDYDVYFGKVEQARAAIAVLQRTSLSMNMTHWQYFDGMGGAYDWKQKTIDLWKAMQ